MGLSLPGKGYKIYTSQWIDTFTDVNHLLVDEGVVHMEAEHWLILRAVSDLDLCITQGTTPIHCPGVSLTGPTHAQHGQVLPRVHLVPTAPQASGEYWKIPKGGKVKIQQNCNIGCLSIHVL